MFTRNKRFSVQPVRPTNFDNNDFHCTHKSFLRVRKPACC